MDRFETKYAGNINGFSLLEMLIAVSIVTILTLSVYKATERAAHASNRLKAKSYLLALQAIQARNWLENGIYKPLKQLDVKPPEGLKITDNTDKTKQSISYNFSVTLQLFPNSSDCRTLAITQDEVLPRHCW
ncbi:prepilin-type N-terminal cleavage/methylation domain-containing protein [Alteromonas sp. S167]|uniref:prepilin-type N-terminal cleavage/methylation domain-containing protein n=1 Tax=Alteromonas sp. S167 TaxID=3117402 RepID=UPI002FDF8DEF